MKFKIDENLPIEIAKLLIENDHDAKTVNEQQLKGANDSVLINLCKQEKRAIITFDTDFSNIREYPPNEYAGIIVLRLSSQAKNHVINVFQKTLLAIETEPLKEHLWIVEDNVIRIRGEKDKF